MNTRLFTFRQKLTGGLHYFVPFLVLWFVDTVACINQELSPPSLSRALCGASPKKEAPTLKEMEQAYILETLGNCDWNITSSAGVLGINRVTLHKKIERYKLRAQKK